MATIGDPFTTAKILKEKVIETFKVKEEPVVKWCGLLNDELLPR